MDGATTIDEDVNFEGGSGSNDDDDLDSDNDRNNCGSDDEFSDEFSDENSEGSDGETTMMWQSLVIEHSDRERGCVENSCQNRGNNTLLCLLLLRVPVKTCACEILQVIETTRTPSCSWTATTTWNRARKCYPCRSRTSSTCRSQDQLR